MSARAEHRESAMLTGGDLGVLESLGTAIGSSSNREPTRSDTTEHRATVMLTGGDLGALESLGTAIGFLNSSGNLEMVRRARVMEPAMLTGGDLGVLESLGTAIGFLNSSGNPEPTWFGAPEPRSQRC